MRFSGVSMAVLAILVILGGVGLGGVLALASRRAHVAQPPAQRVAMVSNHAEPTANPQVPTPAPRTTPTPAITPTRASTSSPSPTGTPAATRTAATTLAPLATATPRPTSISTPAAAVADHHTWRFDEANVAVGTIVWVGSAFKQGSEVIFDLHKQSIGGHPAVPCERNTYLHLMLDRAHPSDTVPYHEVNCDGAGSDGIVRISQVSSPDSFVGSFWDGGTKLGDFVAHAQ